MLRSLSAGVTGLQQFQQKLDVIGNNIANSNTTGFKSARAQFEDNFSQLVQGGASAPVQVGSGVATGSIRSNFTMDGVTASTGEPSHLAINGDGFFMVRDPISDRTFATRAGEFHVDSAGYLVTNGGFRVQGFNDAGLSSRGDIRIDDSGKPQDETGTFDKYFINDKGVIQVTLTSGNKFDRGQVLLQRFTDPNALVKEGNNLYSGFESAGPLAQTEAPDTNGLGTIKSGALEMSNVDLANQFADLITTQRGFQASARIITTSDEILQEVVNLKH